VAAPTDRREEAFVPIDASRVIQVPVERQFYVGDGVTSPAAAAASGKRASCRGHTPRALVWIVIQAYVEARCRKIAGCEERESRENRRGVMLRTGAVTRARAIDILISAAALQTPVTPRSGSRGR